MSSLATSTAVVPWPNQPFILIQDPPGIFFLHDIPALRSFFRWITKQSFDNIAEDTPFALVKERIRAVSPRTVLGMNIFLRAVSMMELTDKDLQLNVRGLSLRCGDNNFPNHTFKVQEWRANDSEATRKPYERICLEECGRPVTGNSGVKYVCARKVYPTHKTLQALQVIVKSLEGV